MITNANTGEQAINRPQISERVRRNRMIALGVTAVAATVATFGPLRLVKDVVTPSYTGPSYTTSQLDKMPKFTYTFGQDQGVDAALAYVDPKVVAGNEPETKNELEAYVGKERGTGPNGEFVVGDTAQIPELPGNPTPPPQP